MNFQPSQGGFAMDPARTRLLSILGAIAVIIVILLYSSTYVVPPGHRGVLVTLGKVSPESVPEGIGLKFPVITTLIPISIRQQTQPLSSEAYSSDLQQITTQIKILYRVPADSVVRIFQEYAGDPFMALIAPRVHEALKEVTAQQNAETIVQKRESIKLNTLQATRRKITDLLVIEDIVIEDVSLSKELEAAIEAKMVQEQEAAKARYVQQKIRIEAETQIIKAKGEAEAIRVRGEALRENPALVQWQIVEKWNGVSPLVVAPGSGGGNYILPLSDTKK